MNNIANKYLITKASTASGLFVIQRQLGQGSCADIWSLAAVQEQQINPKSILPQEQETAKILAKSQLNLPLPLPENLPGELILKRYYTTKTAIEDYEDCEDCVTPSAANIELKAFNKLYPDPRHQLHFIDGQPHLILTYIEGDDLSNRPTKDQFASWSFEDRLNVTLQLVKQLQRLHQNDEKHGGLLHLDLKGSNIKLNAATKEVKILDFDLSQISWSPNEMLFDLESQEITSSDQLRLLSANDGKIATSIFRAPEAIAAYYPGANHLNLGSVGSRSDIFSLAPIILAIWGADDPLSDRTKTDPNIHNQDDFRNAYYYKNQLRANIPYNTEGLLTSLDLPKELAIKQFKKLLLSMGNLEYFERPSIDELVEKLNNIALHLFKRLKHKV